MFEDSINAINKDIEATDARIKRGEEVMNALPEYQGELFVEYLLLYEKLQRNKKRLLYCLWTLEGAE